MDGSRRGSLLLPLVNLTAALVVAAGLLLLLGGRVPAVPPLGAALAPPGGVWSSALDAQPSNQTLHLPGLLAPVRMTFDLHGVPHIQAHSENDLFLTLGYLHATFRLFQMDLLRRQGEGRLAQIVGPAALSSDRFELRLGLLRTARAEWAMERGAEVSVALAYARGVNDRIAEDARTGHWPMLFNILGYRPAVWTPIDSLLIKGDMTQTLDFTDNPLDYAVLARTLGFRRTMAWFPVVAPDLQHPYDTATSRRRARAPVPQPLPAMSVVADLETQLQAIPGALAAGGNSNNWAVNGPRTSTGGALMAGDPHLHLTLPSIWYQVDVSSPTYTVSGVTIPGAPAVLIGHNRHISWSLTDTQNQATLYYMERTDPRRPHQYYWKGGWRPMRAASYSIPVKGGSTEHLTVYLTVHGPIMNDNRVPKTQIAVDWMGNLSSLDLDALLAVGRASNFTQFKAALAGWHAPTQNFVYADDRGNIGMYAPGYYPIVRAGLPWLPLPGTGKWDVVGTVPPSQVPQVYDPPSHLIFSANQRPVLPAYPYYIGTTNDFFDNGYRADRIYSVLSAAHGLTAAGMERLQNDVHDYLAARIVPRLLAALRAYRQTPTEKRAVSILSHWDGSMTASSPGAAIWWTFWSDYLDATFGPWWGARKVPASTFPSLAIGPDQPALDEDLEAWTLRDPHNAAFYGPGTARTAGAPDAMDEAFLKAVGDLTRRLGPNPGNWKWGALHRRSIPSLAQIPALGYGPRSAGGDLWTVDAATNTSTTGENGPSWRFVMDWGTRHAYGVYPGGQSENPASSWYETGIAAWWQGETYPMIDAAQAGVEHGHVTWKLLP